MLTEVYKLRVGKAYFIDPHYVVTINKKLKTASIHSHFTGRPKTWKKKYSAARNLLILKESYPSIEIEKEYL